MPGRSIISLVGVLGLLLGGLVVAGCTPDSSGSTASLETTPASADDTTPPSRDAPTATSSPAASTSEADARTGSDRTVAERLADASVAARVKQALVQNRTLRRFRFSPSVVRGRLTLRGDVETREQYRLAERIAQRQEGVTAVTNQVTVDGRRVATTDDPAGTGAEGTAAYHTVRRGDTLSEIAQEHGVSTQQIRALNDLSGPLQPGQEIRVR